VVAAEQHDRRRFVRRDNDLAPVTESWPRRREPPTRGAHRGPERVVREPSERDDHAQSGVELQLSHQIGPAFVAFGGSRPVRGRRTAHRRGDERVAQRQAVGATSGGRLVGVPGTVQRGEEEIAGSISGEHAPGAGPAVRGGREPHDQQPGARVAETR
jgi:hypothetical protein